MEVSNAVSRESRSRIHRGRRVFTVEQANRTLPLVSRIVADIVAQHERVCLLEERCQINDPSLSADEMQALRDRYADALDDLRGLRAELGDIGCQLKDWRRGIVDYLAFINGRAVELCWRLGEPRIEHWHEVDSGFAARQRIDDPCAHAPH